MSGTGLIIAYIHADCEAIQTRVITPAPPHFVAKLLRNGDRAAEIT